MIKKFLWVAIALLLVAGTAQAGMVAVGVNFAGASINSADPAGVVPYDSWNNVSAATGTGLVNDSGTATGVSFSRNYGINGCVVTGGTTGDRALMSNGIRTNPSYHAQVLLQGISSVMSGSYDVYVTFGEEASFIYGGGTAYLSANASDYKANPTAVSIPGSYLGSQNWFVHQAFAGTWIQGTNYVKFSGINADTLVLTTWNTSGGGGDFSSTDITGIQIVGAGIEPVAEPAGLGMIGVALLALRKRRS